MHTLIEFFDDGECDRLRLFLVDRIEEFNAGVTGYRDGRLLGAAIRNDAGDVIAALNGHTWGGCCVIEHLWVAEAHRGKGFGRALLVAAEAEAALRGCGQVVLSTHSFQAPLFYERLGYERRGVIDGEPRGHSSVIYAKKIQSRGDGV